MKEKFKISHFLNQRLWIRAAFVIASVGINLSYAADDLPSSAAPSIKEIRVQWLGDSPAIDASWEGQGAVTFKSGPKSDRSTLTITRIPNFPELPRPVRELNPTAKTVAVSPKKVITFSISWLQASRSAQVAKDARGELMSTHTTYQEERICELAPGNSCFMMSQSGGQMIEIMRAK